VFFRKGATAGGRKRQADRAAALSDIFDSRPEEWIFGDIGK
jgi:hypothetical protein